MNSVLIQLNLVLYAPEEIVGKIHCSIQPRPRRGFLFAFLIPQ